MKIKASSFFGVRSVFVSLLCFWILSLFCVALHAQTATTGQVVGHVTDPSGAAVPGARVALVEPSTNTKLAAVTNSAGRYSFPVVSPGQYVLTVDKAGFQTQTVTGITVDVMKSNAVNVTLKLGAVAQTVTVAATSGAELQTTNATVGNVLSTAQLENLPQFSRNATSLMFLQPGITPNTGSTNTGGQIAGALSEQVTYTLDGGSATSDLEGTGDYQNSSNPAQAIGAGSSASAIPNPIATTQEFRVVTSGANATFTRSGGGEVTVLTKRGTNQFHGEVYEYHDDDALNANSWANDASNVAKPHSVDNRFGASVGGPFSALLGPVGKPLRNRAWFFFGWEEHRFHDSASFSRVIPTAQLASGIIQLGGKTVNLAPGNISSNCGPNGNLLCDPRNVGMSPVIAKQLALYKNITPNDTLIGDGVNTTGFRFNVATPTREDIGVVRLDFQVMPKWHLFTTYHLARFSRVATNQLNIVSSPPAPASNNPVEPSMITFELTGPLTPNFTTVFHGSYTRNWWQWFRTSPTPFVSGTTQALMLAGEGPGTGGNWSSNEKLFDDPVNINPQNSRSRIWNGHDWYMAGDFSWVHGKHLFQFGASGYIDNEFMATELPFGSLASGPILHLEAIGNTRSQFPGAFLSIGPNEAPPALAGNVTYNELYTALLGLVDDGVQTGARNGSFQPMPLGTFASGHPSQPALYTYFQDTWQMTPNLTGVVGLTWGAEYPYTETNGIIPILVNAATGQPLNAESFISARKASLEQKGVSIVNGQVNALNPLIGITPTDFVPSGGSLPRGQGLIGAWHDFGPRVSVAWNVPFHNALFGHNKQTVIRAGYSIVYDRITGSSAIFPVVLGGGFSDTLTCGGPLMQGTCSGGGTDPTNAFRIGVDGNGVPIPQITAEPIPFVPSGTQATPYGLLRVSQINPFETPGWAHDFTVSVQRALPGHMLVEFGYIGRFGRNLQEVYDLTSPDFRTKDAKSGQTLAQAFDGVAVALRNGTAVPDEPFFDDLIGLSTCTNAGFANCSEMVASQSKSALIDGSLSAFATGAGAALEKLIPGTLNPVQIRRTDVRSGGGFSDYNAGYVSLQKSFSGGGPLGGLAFQVNWTYSHATDTTGHQQQSTGALDTPYDPHIDYSSSSFDRRHVISAWYNYPLPFGKGQWRSISNPFLNRALGGWNVAGVWTFATGLPECVGADGDWGAVGTAIGTCALETGGLNLKNLSGSTHVIQNSHGAQELNLFADPTAVYNSLSRPLLSRDLQIPFGSLRDPISWDWDFEISKNIAMTERYKFIFAADLLNAFNHPTFSAPSLDLASKSTFGRFSSQDNEPRRIQLSMRIKF